MSDLASANQRETQNTQETAVSDLGFGSVVARESRQRFLNRDGTFNVRRDGLRFWESLSAYHYFLTISWPRFLVYMVIAFMTANAIFASVYFALGPEALSGDEGVDDWTRWEKAFFFSVHTLATIGYGNVSPASIGANVVVTMQSIIGLISIAIMAGLVFGRFSRPVAAVLFSEKAIIAPFRGGRAFMFRIANRRSNQLVDLKATVLLSRRKKDGAVVDREFLPLTLERDRVVFFPLSWTIVHPIDEKSPLADVDQESMFASDAEFLILLNGFDETFSQTVHARSSYKSSEIVWGARFTNMFNPPGELGEISVDIRRLHDIEPAAL